VDAVIDTNVFVSAVLSPHGPCAEVQAMVIEGRLVPLVDDRVLAEYETVLARPCFGLEATTLSEFMSVLRDVAWVVTPPRVRIDLPDPSDRCFIECALASVSRILVTGNKRHYPGVGSMGVEVLSPREFLARFGAEASG
jgi:putative PIN family toxin of toxin-antitoxin system